MPILLSASMASLASGRTVSETAITPRIWPFRATNTSEAASLSCLRDDGTATPRSCINAALPTRTVAPSTRAVMPRPGV